MRRFNDPVGLGREGYPVLLALVLFAWHEYNSRGRDARSVVRDVLTGSDWFRKKVAWSVLSCLDSLGYLFFKCQSPIWRPQGWRACPRDWSITVAGYARLRELLANLSLTVDDVLKQPSPLDVKVLIDSRIKAIYREHWERIKAYEAVVSCQP
jgi:hypothetical protein